MIATGTTDPTMYMANLVCTNVCMYKKINKKNATFLIKRDKNHLYYTLSYFELYLFALLIFSTVKEQTMITLLFIC